MPEYPIRYDPPLPYACECGLGRCVVVQWDGNDIDWECNSCKRMIALIVVGGAVVLATPDPP